jgi:NAD(P)-dependent dehydrogenase (short-subunit alcohol dehydrogenase family)
VIGMTAPGRIAEKALELLSLQGKIAVVTGAGSGIGRGICLRLGEMGACVAALDIDEKTARKTVSQIGPAKSAQTTASFTAKSTKSSRTSRRTAGFVPGAIALACDVRVGADCRRAVGSIIDRWGKIDILCNCAGIAIRKDVVDLSEEEWDHALDVTLKGIYLLSHEAIPHMMRSGGSIINIGSGWGLKGGPRAAAYCAAKGGTVNLTRAMAIDHGLQNIRVNCVCPGDVDTPMLRSECAQLGQDERAFMKEAADRPLGRVGTVDDVANAVLFLASPMANWITGAAFVVDGGGLA